MHGTRRASERGFTLILFRRPPGETVTTVTGTFGWRVDLLPDGVKRVFAYAVQLNQKGNEQQIRSLLPALEELMAATLASLTVASIVLCIDADTDPNDVDVADIEGTTS
jgi:hypothetical protein